MLRILHDGQNCYAERKLFICICANHVQSAFLAVDCKRILNVTLNRYLFYTWVTFIYQIDDSLKFSNYSEFYRCYAQFLTFY